MIFLVHVQMLEGVAVDLSKLSGSIGIISTRSCMCRIFSEWYVVTFIPSEFHLCIQATIELFKKEKKSKNLCVFFGVSQQGLNCVPGCTSCI